jgi:hypothetical protein
LIAAAVKAAKKAGAPGLEGYPLDADLTPSASGTGYVSTFLRAGFSQGDGKLSHDGRWVAYVSDETGHDETYVQSFPHPEAKYQVSPNGGDLPTWSADGRELFFVSSDGHLMSVEVRTSANRFEASLPKALFEVHRSWFDINTDGRFLVLTAIGQAASVPWIAVMNWPTLLKK